MRQSVKDFVADNSGVTVIEYGLIAILIGVAIAAVVGSVGTNLGPVFTSVSTAI